VLINIDIDGILENIKSNLKIMVELPNSPVAKLKEIQRTHSLYEMADQLKFKAGSDASIAFNQNAFNFLQSVISYDSSKFDVVHHMFINAQASIAILNFYQRDSFNIATDGSITNQDLLVCILSLFTFNLFSFIPLFNEIDSDIIKYFGRPYAPGVLLLITDSDFVKLRNIQNYFVLANISNSNDETIFHDRIQEATRNSELEELEEEVVNLLLDLTIPKYGSKIPPEVGARVIQAVCDSFVAQQIIPQVVGAMQQFPVPLSDLAKLKKIRNILIAIAIGVFLSGAIATVAWAALTSIGILQFIPLIIGTTLAVGFACIALKFFLDAGRLENEIRVPDQLPQELFFD
jgi:hypothetical protein